MSHLSLLQGVPPPPCDQDIFAAKTNGETLLFPNRTGRHATKHKVKKRKRSSAKTKRISGNYHNYYGYRHSTNASDGRLKFLQPAWFHNRACLDVGCNSGRFSVAVALKFGCATMTGIDIDPLLIARAQEELKSLGDTSKDTCNASCAGDRTVGSLGCGDSAPARPKLSSPVAQAATTDRANPVRQPGDDQDRTTESCSCIDVGVKDCKQHPHKISFRCEDIMQPSAAPVAAYDVRGNPMFFLPFECGRC